MCVCCMLSDCVYVNTSLGSKVFPLLSTFILDLSDFKFLLLPFIAYNIIVLLELVSMGSEATYIQYRIHCYRS